MDFIFITESSRHKNKDLPPENQGWFYLVYNITKINGRKECVAMIPTFIIGAGDKKLSKMSLRLLKISRQNP